ncbi:protein translocase subunit SecD [bacterium (Candidatus Gribaldobacteria) CG_4_9_14_3_um_filter_36_15]|uniref:Protein translocase subunit SecD n=2 Tax=Candidatus Gribaldobacteria TaxID=2798536 RepID=A0A2H0UWZ1_9BACT|nr:MAG: protein translocase subunit SecD [bacterium (Candidatus Gribaldobacteria) CG10_big_fil_rev_8_21_14_0_10_37_46]PJB09237.1 MAG: protein translocase subunit SecD [bacterium (Candidatus Gribaldobacteria) CG_4_9_14_3_um_filter_36_15]
MTRKQTNVNLLVIVILAFLGLNFAYPKYLNQGIDYFQLGLPHFPEVSFKLGLDLQGGSHLVYEADLSKIEAEERNEAMQGLRDVIERRVNLFGVGEPMVRIQEQVEHKRLVVELPGVKNIEEAIGAIGKTPYLEFKEERPEEERDEILAKYEQFEGKSFEEVQEIPDWQLILKEDPYFKSTKLTGQYLKKAELGFDQTTFEPEVFLEFNEEGKDIFKELTSLNVGKHLAIYIDESLISAPVVKEAITDGKARITGRFTIEEAKSLARNLNAGALPVPIKLISQKTVGPVLGKISLEKSLKAGLIGFLMVILFMIGFYRGPGILSSLALMIYAGIILSLFKLIPVTLTLAGIGGVVLSVGMAVDANVLIFERMREERRVGRSFQRAIEIGFSRAWPSIRDGNLTTLLVALIMFFCGSSFIKGFALTLSLGVLVSMFSAVFVTRTFLRSFIGTRLEKIKFLWD